MHDFDWEKQAYKEPLKSDKHQSLHNEHDRKKSRGRKGTPAFTFSAAFTFSLVTSLVAAGVGFNYLREEPQKIEQNDPPLDSLKITGFDTAIAMADPNGENLLKDPVVQELQQDLQETKERLGQLKKDILIRGGEKESYYKKLISTLEKNLEDAEMEIQNLRNELVERTSFLESKSSENENLLRQYQLENQQLKSRIENDYQADFESSKDALNTFSKELNLTDDEEESFQYIEEILDATRAKIRSLEEELENAYSKVEQEHRHAALLENQLAEKESQLALSRNEIDQLHRELSNTHERYAHIENEINNAVHQAYSNTRNLTNLDQIKIMLTGEKARANILEKQLLSEIGKKKAEQNTSIAIEENIDYYKKNSKSAPPTQSTTNQDKLIEDLTRNLELSQTKNLELQQKINNLEMKNNNASKSDYGDLNSSIEKRMNNAQQHIDKIEKEVVNDSADKYKDFLYEDNKDLLESKKEQLRLQKSIQDLDQKLREVLSENQQLKQDYQNLLQEKERKIQELKSKVKSASNDVQSKFDQEKIYQLTKAYESEIRTLRNELNKTSQDLAQLRNGEIVFNEDFFKNRIKKLESALEAQKEALLAAQEQVLNSQNDNPMDNKEEYYLSKINSLTEKNRLLEEQLAESEEYLTQNQERMLGDQQNKLNLINLLEEKDQKIASLEREKNSFVNGDYSSFFDQENNEAELKKKLEELSRTLVQERQIRNKIENEMAFLREEFIKNKLDSKTIETSHPTSDNVAALEKLDLQQTKVKDLEERLHAMSKWNEKLQKELAAYESEQHLNLAQDETEGNNPKIIDQLKAKIKYLATRLEQETETHNFLEAKLEEMGITFKEMQQRNTLLEKKIREAGLKIF